MGWRGDERKELEVPVILSRVIIMCVCESQSAVMCSIIFVAFISCCVSCRRWAAAGRFARGAGQMESLLLCPLLSLWDLLSSELS